MIRASFPLAGFIRSDEDGGDQRTSPASGASKSNTAPVRERNLKQMGEAPVKYELTGASCHLQAEACDVA
jgi:hypothetical protein